MADREWDIREQARKAKASFDERPEWVKSISYFAGTNSVPLVCRAGLCPRLPHDGSQAGRKQPEGRVSVSAKEIPNPVQVGLDSICAGNDSAIGRVFGVSRQSVGQWRKFSSIPRHFMRTFSILTGIPVERLLEYAELNEGISFVTFCEEATTRAREEGSIDKTRRRA